MPTINALGAITLTLAPADSVQITSVAGSEGTVVITEVGRAYVSPATTLTPRTIPFGPPGMTRTIGPFAQGATVTLTCTRGSLDYVQTVAAKALRTSPRMLAVFCGNSIGTASQYTGVATGYTMKSEFILANTLAGAPMRLKNRPSGATRLDVFGCHGYSSQILSTINTDLATNFYPVLIADGTVPDLVCAIALVENDISSSTPYATMVLGIQQWIRTTRSTWPNAKLWLCTPRPSRSNTVAQCLLYTQIRDYMLSLDDGKNIFVTRCDGYDSATSGIPQTSTFTASISGTTMTVTDAGAGIRLGCVFDGSGVTANTTISSAGTATSNGDGTYGVGTYTVSNSLTIASTTMTQCLFTDVSVHPNARGALINARLMAATLQRIAAVFTSPYLRGSSNFALTGTGAASGTGASGTVPTNCSSAGSANGSFVNVAEQPGWTITYNQTAAGSVADLAQADSGSLTIAGSTIVSPYAVIELVSGSQYARAVTLEPRINDGAGNAFSYGLKVAGSDPDMDWQDGDVLTFAGIPIQAVSGSIIAAKNYYRHYEKAWATQPITYRVREQACELIDRQPVAARTGLEKVVNVPTASVLTLNASPVTLLGAPGAGLAYIVRGVEISKPAGTAYVIGSGTDLALKYTNGSGAQVTGDIKTTGFLDQTTAQPRYVGMPGSTGTTQADVTPVANAPVVLHITSGEVTTGNCDLNVRVRYDIVTTVFTA